MSEIAPNLTQLAVALGRALGRAFRESRPQRYAWPAAALVLIDGAVRGLPVRHISAVDLVQYGTGMLVMAVVWGGLGVLLWVAAQYVRVRRWGAVCVTLPLPALATLLLLSLSVLRLAFFSINGYFAEPAMLRVVWPLRRVIFSYASALPGVSAPAITGAFGLWLGLLGQAWRRSRPRPFGPEVSHTRESAGLGVLMVTVALLAADGRRGEAATPASSPPDAGALFLALQAARPPPPFFAPVRRGAFRREPLTVPALTRVGLGPNVLVILTESVRADAMCSDPRACKDEYIDPPAFDRTPLSRLRTQAPGTFTTCMGLWTGLDPSSQYPDTHRAPLLWEVAHAAGYRTMYVSAQSSEFFHFGDYIASAGIDFLLTARDLQPDHSVTVGADDEKAMAATLEQVSHVKGPWYGVLHLSNTHAMYRTDPSLQPFQPESAGPTVADLEGLKNRYRNAIALQRRSLGAFLTELRRLPSFNHTLVVFLSDHGEPLGDHGEIFHRDSLFEAAMRVPGWILAGSSALTPEQRAALDANHERYLYTRDLHATVLDALGVWEERMKIPYAGSRAGRSVLRPMPVEEPIVVFANVSGLWDFATPQYGIVQGERKLLSGPYGPFRCYDLRSDPREAEPRSAPACGADLFRFAKEHYSDLIR